MKEFAVGSVFIAAVGGMFAALFFGLQMLEGMGSAEVAGLVFVALLFAPAKFVGEGFLEVRKRSK